MKKILTAVLMVLSAYTLMSAPPPPIQRNSITIAPQADLTNVVQAIAGTNGGGPGSLPRMTINFADVGGDWSGDTDVSGALQTVLAGFAATKGGTLYVPHGKYTLNNPVQISTRNVWIRGDGSKLAHKDGTDDGKTVFIVPNANQAAFVYVGDDIDNQHLSDLSIVGPTNTTSAAIQIVPSTSANMDHSVFENLYIDGFSIAVSNYNIANTAFRNMVVNCTTGLVFNSSGLSIGVSVDHVSTGIPHSKTFAMLSGTGFYDFQNCALSTTNAMWIDNATVSGRSMYFECYGAPTAPGVWPGRIMMTNSASLNMENLHVLNVAPSTVGAYAIKGCTYDGTNYVKIHLQEWTLSANDANGNSIYTADPDNSLVTSFPAGIQVATPTGYATNYSTGPFPVATHASGNEFDSSSLGPKLRWTRAGQDSSYTHDSLLATYNYLSNAPRTVDILTPAAFSYFTNNASGMTNFPGPISIRDFGAVGDASTDDTAAIQRAVNYAASTGRKITVPARERPLGYKVTGPIIITNCGVYIEGEGGLSEFEARRAAVGTATYGSAFIFTSTTTNMFVSTRQSNNYMTFKDLQFYAPSNSVGSAIWFTNYPAQSYNCRVLNCTFDNWGTALYFRGSGVFVDGCQFNFTPVSIDNRSLGAAGNDGVVIRNCSFNANYFALLAKGQFLVENCIGQIAINSGNPGSFISINGTNEGVGTESTKRLVLMNNHVETWSQSPVVALTNVSTAVVAIGNEFLKFNDATNGCYAFAFSGKVSATGPTLFDVGNFWETSKNGFNVYTDQGTEQTILSYNGVGPTTVTNSSRAAAAYRAGYFRVNTDSNGQGASDTLRGSPFWDYHNGGEDYDALWVTANTNGGTSGLAKINMLQFQREVKDQTKIAFGQGGVITGRPTNVFSSLPFVADMSQATNWPEIPVSTRTKQTTFTNAILNGPLSGASASQKIAVFTFDNTIVGEFTSAGAGSFNFGRSDLYAGDSYPLSGQTTAALVGFSGSTINFYANSGLTPGNAFVPTTRLKVNDTGTFASAQIAATNGVVFPQLSAYPTNDIVSSANNTNWSIINTNGSLIAIKTNTAAAGSWIIKHLAP